MKMYYILEKRGKKGVSPELFFHIQAHLKSLSEIAPNKTVLIVKNGKRTFKPARFMKCSFRDAFMTFTERDELSYSCFFSYIGKEYKKPHRATDLCDYCENGKSLIKEIKQFVIQHEIPVSENDSNFEEVLTRLETIQINSNSPEIE